ncbi:MAG: type II toxin-antitoxin system VapC family toxin [Sphingomonadales bacterium]
MIVLDGSALFAILLGEPGAQRCEDAIEHADELLMSAASLTECLIVAAGKGVHDEMAAFLDGLHPTIVPVTVDRARAAADAYRAWGKGFHKASLNFGDSFAYALAMEHECPLLFVGDDFSRTDVVRVGV